jgi:predicted RNA-binding Zn-ribbon protein involved in translation (DUF1610 family)
VVTPASQLKTCSHCRKPKPVDQFRKLDTGGRGSWCRPCVTNYSRARRDQRIAAGQCPQCGEPWSHLIYTYCATCRRIGRIKKGYAE